MKSTLTDADIKCTQHCAMRPEIIFRIARKNLFAKKLRTALTVTGVVIGVGAVIFLVSFGVGLQRLVEKQVVGSKSIKTIDVTTQQVKNIKLDTNTIERLSGIAGVDKIGKVYTVAGKIKSANSESAAVIYGSDQTYLDLSSLNKVAGQLISADDLSLAIVNTSFLKAQAITDNNKAIGQKITISFDVPATDKKLGYQATKEVTVRGIIESGSGSEIFIPAYIIENEGIVGASQLKVLTKDRDVAAKVRTDIESLGFSTASPLDTISEIDKIFQLLQVMLIGFGGIGMVIAILGMFNTLTITLLERTREIALIVTLGGQQRDIKRLFIVEALMLSMMGGIAGIFSAFLIGRAGDLVLNIYAHSNGVTDNLTAFYISPLLVISSLILTALVGLAVVYFPARRAARISPLDAMRNE